MALRNQKARRVAGFGFDHRALPHICILADAMWNEAPKTTPGRSPVI